MSDLPISAADLVPFTPRPGGPTYRLRPPTLRSHAAVQRDLAAEGIRTARGYEYVRLLRAGLQAGTVQLLPGDQAVIDALEAHYDQSAEPIEARLWTAFQHIIDGYAATAILRAGLTTQSLLTDMHMIRQHLVIDGVPAPLSEDQVNAAIPLADQRAIARRLDQLANPTPDTVGNSGSPSPSPSGTSDAAAASAPPTAAPDGTSSASTTPPTPAA